MKHERIDDELWALVEPRLPAPKPGKTGAGRPRLGDRAARNGILFCAAHRHALGAPAPATGLWQRHDVLQAPLHEWQTAGARGKRCIRVAPGSPARRWAPRLEPREQRLKPVLPAPGGEHTGPSPTDCGKLGSKRHLAVDARGTPLAILSSAAHCHDSKLLEPLMHALPAVAGLPHHQHPSIARNFLDDLRSHANVPRPPARPWACPGAPGR